MVALPSPLNAAETILRRLCVKFDDVDVRFCEDGNISVSLEIFLGTGETLPLAAIGSTLVEAAERMETILTKHGLMS